MWGGHGGTGLVRNRKGNTPFIIGKEKRKRNRSSVRESSLLIESFVRLKRGDKGFFNNLITYRTPKAKTENGGKGERSGGASQFRPLRAREKKEILPLFVSLTKEKKGGKRCKTSCSPLPAIKEGREGRRGLPQLNLFNQRKGEKGGGKA